MADYAGEYSRQHHGDSFNNLQRLTYIKCKTGKTNRWQNGIINNDECQHNNKDKENGKLSIQALQQKTNNPKCSCHGHTAQSSQYSKATALLKSSQSPQYWSSQSSQSRDGVYQLTEGAKDELTTHRHGTRMMACYMKAGMHARNAIRKARWDWRQVFAPKSADIDPETDLPWTGDKETKLVEGKPAKGEFPKGKNFKVEKKVVVKKNHVLPEARLAGYNMFGDNSKAKVEGRKYTNQPNFGMAVEIGARAGGLSKIFSASAGAKETLKKAKNAVNFWSDVGTRPTRSVFLVSAFQLDPNAYIDPKQRKKNQDERMGVDGTRMSMEKIANHMKEQVATEEDEAAKEIKELMKKPFFKLLLPAPINPANKFCFGVVSKAAAPVCPSGGLMFDPPPAATFLEEKEVSSMTQNWPWTSSEKAKKKKAKTMCKDAGGQKDGASSSGPGGEFWPKILTSKQAKILKKKSKAKIEDPRAKEFVTEMAMCFPSLRRARSWLCALGLQARAVNPNAYNPDDRTTTANKAVSFRMLLGKKSFEDMRGVSVHSGKQCSCSDTQANWFKCYKSGKRTDKSMFKDEKDIKWRDCDMCEDCHENDIGIGLPDFNPYDDDQAAKDAGAEGTLHMNPLDAWCAGGEDVADLDDTLSETIVAPGRMEIEEAVSKMKGKNAVSKEALDDTPEEAAKEFKNTEDFKPGGLGDQGKEEDGANPTGDGCEEDDANGDIDAEDEDEADEEDSDSVSENF